MPIKVVLQTLAGKRFEEAVPPASLLNRILPSPEDASYPLLRFVDPYGDTLFNGIQMHGFLKEWDRLAERTAVKEELDFLARVRVMAERCKSEPHVFLRFIGD